MDSKSPEAGNGTPDIHTELENYLEHQAFGWPVTKYLLKDYLTDVAGHTIWTEEEADAAIELFEQRWNYAFPEGSSSDDLHRMDTEDMKRELHFAGRHTSFGSKLDEIKYQFDIANPN